MGAADLGTPMWVVYECVGSGKEEISTYDRQTLRVSLKKAIKKMGIPLSRIQEISYAYRALSLNSTPLDNNIPNGGVIAIKLKSPL